MSPMNNRKLVPTQEPGVLDFAPGAAAAYSLRNLSLSYSGPVVTVRRSTDNAEADFTASEVSDGTLAAWCGGGDGFVKQWWSQTGSNHASNSTAAQQPKLVSIGVLVTEGGKAAVRFDGTNDHLLAATVSAAQPNHYFFVAKRDSLSGKQPYSDGLVGRNEICIQPFGDRLLRLFAGTVFLTSYTVTASHEQSSVLFNGASTSVHVDGVNVASGNAGTQGIDQLVIGADGPLSFFLQGTMQEMLLYPTDMTALRTRIEGNINRHFGVF